MGWVKLDDAFLTDDKSVLVGLEGRALFISGLTWCARNETDGRIERDAVAHIAALAGVQPDIAARLTERGLWTDEGTHLFVPKYLEYNPSREQLVAKRAADASRQKSRRDSQRDAEPVSGVSPRVPSRPVPDSLNQSSSSSNEEGRSQAVDEALGVFTDLRTAAASPETPERYRKTVWKNAVREQSQQAREWLERYDVTPAEIGKALHVGAVPQSWANCRRQAAS